MIFDLFGTLVEVFSFEKHQSVLEEMAVAVSAPPAQFTRLWVATFNQRGTGAFPTIESNIEHICRVLDVSPDAAGIAAAARIRHPGKAA